MVERLFTAAAVAAALTLTSSACWRHSQADLEQVDPNTPVILHVTNNNQQDVNIYVTGGDDRWRLGTVTTGQTESFEVPTSVTHTARDFQILVHPIGGGGDYSTGRVPVSPGDEVEVHVGAALGQTSLMVSQP